MATQEEIQAKINQRLLGQVEQPVSPESVSVSPDLADLRKRLDDEQKKLNMSKAQRESDEVAWSEDDSVAAAERFFSSMALGWGDELQLWHEAQIESRFFSDESYEDIHKRLREEYDLRQAEFQARQPGAYMAADIAGSIASPVNFIPGVNVAARLGMAGKTAKALNTAGRVAAESAVYGSGEAGEGQRLEGAVSGTGAGLLGYGVLRGGMRAAGGTANLFTRRNIEGDLVDEMGNFTPITLVADKPTGSEGFLHTLYTDVISPSFGGKGIITQQEQKVLTPLKEIIAEKNKMAKKMRATAKLEEKRMAREFTAGSAALKEEFKEVKKAMEAEINTKKIKPLEEKLKLLNTKKPEQLFKSIPIQQQRITDSLQHHFRNSALIESMPAVSTSKDVADVLSIPDIHGQMRALDNLWNENGYKMIKDKKIRINVGSINQSFAKMIDSDDFIGVNAVEKRSFMNTLTSLTERVAKFRDKNNRIDGGVIAELRSDIGKQAARQTDPQMRASYYQVQAELDKLVDLELTPTQKKQFAAERGKYKAVSVLRDAVESTAKVKGAFTPEDWQKSLDKNNKWDKRYGTGTLRKESDEVINQINSSNRLIGRLGSKVAKAKAFKIQEVVEDHRNKLAAEVEKLSLKKKAVQQGREKDFDKALEAKLADPKIKNMENEIQILDDRLATLKQLSATENPSWFHTLAAHSMIGGVIRTLGLGTAGAMTGGLGGAVAIPAAAYGLSKGLATPTGQRILAGQTRPQMTTQRLLQADATGRTADILARSIGRTGLLTGGQQ